MKVSITNQRKDLPSFKTNSITLKYIINTLVSNAQKYSKPSDKQPDFFLSHTAEYLLLELRDYVIGISADKIEMMGKPQTKVNENQEVSGIGYYLAEDLTERLRYIISILSREKKVQAYLLNSY